MLGKITRFLAAIILFSSVDFIGEAIAQPIGEVFTVGRTWQELQWSICGVEEMIALDTIDNTVYFDWTRAEGPSYYFRSYFNSYNSQSGLAYADSGRCILPGVIGQQLHTVLIKGDSGGLGDVEFGMESMNPLIGIMSAWWEADSFASSNLDTSYSFIKSYARRALSPNGDVQVVAFDGHNAYLYYGRYHLSPFNFSGWQFIDSISLGTYNIGTSPVSNRTVIAYSTSTSGPLHRYPYYLDRNFYIIESPDGLQWDWQNRRNITHFGYSNPLRPLYDGDILIDHNDHLHLAFTTMEVLVDSLNPGRFRTNWFMTYLWHWSEQADSFSVIAEGWIHQPPTDSCDFSCYKWPVDEVQLAEDPASGNLYAVYQRHSFGDCSHGPAYPNGEIWVSVSTDGGLNWSEGVNISNTPTPDCHPWHCASEMQLSINDYVNDTLHILYIRDRDAGVADCGEDLYVTEAQVIYHRVPVDLIPTTPLINQFSIYKGPERCFYIPGDINGDSVENGIDVVYAVNFFKGSQNVPPIDCDCEGISRPYYAAGDVNGSCTFNGMDITFYVAYLKRRQPKILFCPGCPPDESIIM